ncbi:hypothetical protein ACLOJK_025719 [Asimina triloba]
MGAPSEHQVPVLHLPQLAAVRRNSGKGPIGRSNPPKRTAMQRANQATHHVGRQPSSCSIFPNDDRRRNPHPCQRSSSSSGPPSAPRQIQPPHSILQPTVSAQIWPWPDPAIAARSPLNDTRRTPTASHRQSPRPPAPPLADAHVPASDQRPAAALHRRRKIQPPYSVHSPPDIRIQIATASQPIAPSLIHDPSSSPPSIGVSSPQARHRAQQATAAARRLPPDSSPRATVHDATNHPDLTASNPTPLSPPPAPPTCKPQQKHFHLTPIHIQNAITWAASSKECNGGRQNIMPKLSNQREVPMTPINGRRIRRKGASIHREGRENRGVERKLWREASEGRWRSCTAR